MAITFDNLPTSEITLTEFCEYIDKTYSAISQESLIASALYLSMLSYNRTFLVDKIIEQLKDITYFQPHNEFTSQSIMLGGVVGKFYVRANVWLPSRLLHKINTAGEKRLFSFETPHDHNFEFITVGYLGQGYETIIHEYDGLCRGEVGEKVELEFVERTSLLQHKVMLYRASRDIHTQKVPEEDFSISLNLLAPPYPNREQYVFDIENRTIADFLAANYVGQRRLIEAAGHLCDDNVSDVLMHIATKHSVGKTREVARKALALRWPDLVKSIAEPQPSSRS